MRLAFACSLGLSTACFGEAPDNIGGASDPSSGSAEPSTSTSGPTTTTATTTATATATSDASTGVADSSGTGSTLCTWELGWQATAMKDIVLVVHQPPTNVGALLMLASTTAMPGVVHVSAFSGCDEAICGVGCCGEQDGAYEHQTNLVASMDPIEEAAAAVPTDAVLRPDVRRRVVVVTDIDTVWTPAMVAGHPMLSQVQIDVRIVSPVLCDQMPLLEAIATATNGTYSCGDLEAAMIIDEVLLRPQPECDLYGDVETGPGSEMPASMMRLDGTTIPPNPMPAMTTPPGPSPCANDPQGWTIADGEDGHLRLCPLACRDVANWQDLGLAAALDFDCG